MEGGGFTHRWWCSLFEDRGCPKHHIQLLVDEPRPLPGRRDLPSQARGADVPSSPGPSVPSGLAREKWNLNSSTHGLYGGKCWIFEEWCHNRGTMCVS